MKWVDWAVMAKNISRTFRFGPCDVDLLYSCASNLH